MYFTLTYDIITKVASEQEDARVFIKSCFKGLYWVKPLTTHFVAKCEDERIRKNVLKKLIEYTKTNPNKIRFILSPLIDTGQLTGVTSKELWPHLKNISQTDIDDLF